MSLERWLLFFKKMISETKYYARMLHQKRGALPKENDFQEFFYLFHSIDTAREAGFEIARNIKVDEAHSQQGPNRPYASFDEFLKDCALE